MLLDSVLTLFFKPQKKEPNQLDKSDVRRQQTKLLPSQDPPLIEKTEVLRDRLNRPETSLIFCFTNPSQQEA